VSTPRFDALLFDAGGVVVIPDPHAIGDALGVATTFRDGHRAHYAAMRALEGDALAAGGTPSIEHLDWDVYRAAYATSLGVLDPDLAHARLARIWSALLWRARIEESVAALWKLFHRKVPIGIVSNASGQIEGILRVQGVCQVGAGAGVPVTVVVDSHVVGVAKPDPRIFDPALEALGNPDRSRVGYIGDSFINDVAGAAAAGLVPLHLDPYRMYADFGHERIESLHDLLEWV
jgi:hypothetical protein